MEDYHAGKSTVTYPDSIKNNVHAQAFYGVLSAVFDEAKEAEVSPDFVAEICLLYTSAQERAYQESREDLKSSRIFNRWMMVIAVIAMLAAIASPIVTILVSNPQ